MSESTFFGHPVKYWLELEGPVRDMNLEGMVEEIANLRGKVSFYESRIIELNKFMEFRKE